MRSLLRRESNALSRHLSTAGSRDDSLFLLALCLSDLSLGSDLGSECSYAELVGLPLAPLANVRLQSQTTARFCVNLKS